MDDETVTGWAIAAQHGDRDAAAAFVRATTPSVRRLLAHLTEPEQVDDLVQETYGRAFAALGRYARQAPARLWLLAIARRVAADHVRAARSRPRISASEVEPATDRRRPAPSPAGRVELHQLIAALDEQRREAFVLTMVLGLSYAEAAQTCGCPIGTIRSRVFRARADLLSALGHHDTRRGALGN